MSFWCDFLSAGGVEKAFPCSRFAPIIYILQTCQIRHPLRPIINIIYHFFCNSGFCG